MTKKAYITILGRSSWSLINTFYAVAEHGYHPDVVHVFAEENYAHELEKIVKGLEVISSGYNFTPKIQTHVVGEADFIDAGEKIFPLVKVLKEEGHTLAIDITPGRKALVCAALIPATMSEIDHIFYLAIKSLENAARPYCIIPQHIQQLRDFIEEKEEMMPSKAT